MSSRAFIRSTVRAIRKGMGGGGAGRCPFCCWPDPVPVFFRQMEDGTRVQETETPPRCAACGREPNITEIDEIIVNSREEVEALDHE